MKLFTGILLWMAFGVIASIVFYKAGPRQTHDTLSSRPIQVEVFEEFETVCFKHGKIMQCTLLPFKEAH